MRTLSSLCLIAAVGCGSEVSAPELDTRPAHPDDARPIPDRVLTRTKVISPRAVEVFDVEQLLVEPAAGSVITTDPPTSPVSGRCPPGGTQIVLSVVGGETRRFPCVDGAWAGEIAYLRVGGDQRLVLYALLGDGSRLPPEHALTRTLHVLPVPDPFEAKVEATLALDQVVARRGTATAEFGAHFTPDRILGSDHAPVPDPEVAAGFGRIVFSDAVDPERSYALYVTSAGAIYKWDRLAPQGPQQYIGALNYAECANLGQLKSATDRVIQPALGLNLNFGVEGALTRGLFRSNFGCMNGHYSVPYPANNYQGAGSGAGAYSPISSPPTWDAATQTAYFTSRPLPWIFYPQISSGGPAFDADFQTYADRDLIRAAFLAALDDVELRVAIRILPDGTITYAWQWTALTESAWMEHPTDGLWAALSPVPGGRVQYVDGTRGTIDVTETSGVGLYGEALASSGGFATYFVDRLRSDLAVGFHFGSDPRAGNISIGLFPGGANLNDPASSAPALFTTNMFPHSPDGWGPPPSEPLYRQMFFTLGTAAQIAQAHAALSPFITYSSN